MWYNFNVRCLKSSSKSDDFALKWDAMDATILVAYGMSVALSNYPDILLKERAQTMKVLKEAQAHFPSRENGRERDIYSSSFEWYAWCLNANVEWKCNLLQFERIRERER